MLFQFMKCVFSRNTKFFRHFWVYIAYIVRITCLSTDTDTDTDTDTHTHTHTQGRSTHTHTHTHTHILLEVVISTQFYFNTHVDLAKIKIISKNGVYVSPIVEAGHSSNEKALKHSRGRNFD